MHMIVFGVLHATALLVVAFFVAFAAAKTGGLLRILGGLLALWLIILAAASIWVGVTHKGHPMRGWMEGPANAAAPLNAATANNVTY
ncbi:MAG TPA: hypothetical protein VGN38_07355 [Caulobacteraceae bacterium]|nr:hypothetical protein [Caulobacteraceae bacterium]